MIPLKIILHHSLTKDGKTVSTGAIRKWHMGLIGQPDILKPDYNPYVKNPMKGIGYHYLIELIDDHYEVLFGRMSNDGSTPEAGHTSGHNHDSLGICLIGNFDTTEVPPGQWKACIWLVRWLMTTYHIPAKNILGHRDFAPYKSCPGKKFDVNLFRLNMLTWDETKEQP